MISVLIKVLIFRFILTTPYVLSVWCALVVSGRQKQTFLKFRLLMFSLRPRVMWFSLGQCRSRCLGDDFQVVF